MTESSFVIEISPGSGGGGWEYSSVGRVLASHV